MAKLTCHVKPIETKDYPTPATRPHYSLLNKTKIKSTFNLEIPYWKDSLDECLRKLGERK
ncbi:MAG: sugar nucleotide-binding protein [Arcobacteraceae bacterium]